MDFHTELILIAPKNWICNYLLNMLILQQIINTMNTITTITELPDDIIKIILRRVIVSSSIEAYFCINTRFTDILNNMSKKYGEYDNFYCLACSNRHIPIGTRKQKAAIAN